MSTPSSTPSSTPTYASGGPRPAPGTITQLFFEAIERFNKPDAIRYKARGQWHDVSHREVEESARRVALALGSLGIGPGDRVGILSENRPEWAIADYGCLTARLTDVPVYPTLPAEQIPAIVNDSGAIVLFLSTEVQAAKIAAVRKQMPSLQHVISFVSPAPPGVDLTWDELLARGKAAESPETTAGWKRDALTVQPDDLATLIYTSGTTGTPKGVMLTHDNLHSNLVAARTKIPFHGNDSELSFLPLSHSFQRIFDYLAWVTGTSISYAESIDAVPFNISEVRPTIMCSAPRLYEKMYARVLENALRGGAVKKQVFFWARAVGERWTDATLAGRTPGALLAWQYRVATSLVFSKLQARMGGRLRYFVSGSAPLATEIHKFFYSAGLVILEGYGLTETSPILTVNTPEHFKLGTVGRPIDGVEVRIADDGEIVVRGPNIMKGYYHKPEATREVLTNDGWFSTGDIGTLDDGFVRITDRKKDLIKTSGGKYLAPQPIENRVKMNKYVAEAVLIGESRKFPSLLIVPNFEHLEKWAALRNIIWTDRAQLLQMPTIQAKMEKEVSEAYAGLARFETPKKIALLEHEFSIDGGELTPSLKVRRKFVDKKYKATIDKLYEEPAP